MEDKRGLKVGDYVYCSWGYDQTNVDFYKVVGLVGKASVEVVPVKSIVNSSEPPCDKVSASDEVADYDVLLKFKPKGEEWERSWKPEDGPVMKRAKDGRVRLSDGYSAYKWDGEPMYETSAGWGH